MNLKNPNIEHLFRSLRTKRAEEFLSTPDLDLGAIDDYGRTLLHEAIAFGKFDVALALIDRGAPLDAQDSKGQTALQYAATFSAPDLARRLLESGANPNVIDKFGNSALWTAALLPKRNYELIELLIAKGGDPHHRNNAGRSVLDFARQSANERLWTICGGAKDVP